MKSKNILIEYMAIDRFKKKVYFNAADMEQAVIYVENYLDLSNEPYHVYLSTREGRGNAVLRDSENMGEI